MKPELKKALVATRWDASRRTQVLPFRIKDSTFYEALDLFYTDKTNENLSIIIDLLSEAPNKKGDPLALNLLSLAFLASDDYEKADKYNEQALQTVHKYISAFYSNNCAINLAKQEYKKAEEAALKARNYYPLWHGPHCNLMAVLRRTDRFDEIDAVAVEMVKLWPESINDSELLKQLRADLDLRDCVDCSEQLKNILNQNKGEK